MATTFLNSEICQPDGSALAAPSAVAFLAAFLPTGAVQDLTGSKVADPSALCNTGFVPRMHVTDADASITSAWMRLTGTNIFGETVQDTRYTNVAGSDSYDFAKVFYTITEILVIGVDFTGADQISLGVAPILGLPVQIGAASDVLVARVDSTVEGSPTIDATNLHWTPTLEPNASRRFYVNVLDPA